MDPEELVCYEVSRRLVAEHLAAVRRSLVLLARLQNGEKLKPEEVSVVARARTDLRAVANLLEAGL